MNVERQQTPISKGGLDSRHESSRVGVRNAAFLDIFDHAGEHGDGSLEPADQGAVRAVARELLETALHGTRQCGDAWLLLVEGHPLDGVRKALPLADVEFLGAPGAQSTENRGDAWDLDPGFVDEEARVLVHDRFG